MPCKCRVIPLVYLLSCGNQDWHASSAISHIDDRAFPPASYSGNKKSPNKMHVGNKIFLNL